MVADECLWPAIGRRSTTNDEHGKICTMHHCPRHAAEQKLLHRAVAASADNDQVRIPSGRRFQQADRR